MAQERKIAIHTERQPSYYDEFHCLADGCRINCCCGWSVTMDKSDYGKLRSLHAGKELRALLDDDLKRARADDPNAPAAYYAELSAARQGVCRFQTEEGLCRIQREEGERALPEICRQFPRLSRFTPGGYHERYLGLGCERVLELLWRHTPVRFDMTPYRSNGQQTFYHYKATPWLDHWEQIRAVCIDILQYHALPLNQRILLLGLRLKALAGGEADAETWVNKSRWLLTSFTLAETLSDVLPHTDAALASYLENSIYALYRCNMNHPRLAALRDELLAALDTDVKRTATASFVENNADGTKTFRFNQDSWQDAVRVTETTLAAWRGASARWDAAQDERGQFMENLAVAAFFNMGVPFCDSAADLEKSFVRYCSLYSFFRFMAVMSCREGAAADKAALFDCVVAAARSMMYNRTLEGKLADEFFANDSASLAHMAILLAE